MKNLLLGLVLFFTLNAYSQNTHTVNFEVLGSGANWDWTIEENGANPPLEFIANPVGGGINSSPTVAKFIAMAGGEPWALCYTDDDGEFTFNASNSTVKILVYKEITSNVAIKFEGFSPAIEIQIPNTLTNQWEELTFDFSASEGNTYNRLVIIPDFEARTEDHIIYFDNIQLPNGVVVGPLPEPSTAPPIPSQEQVDVLSVYSEEYTNLPGTNFNPNWGQSTIVTLDYNVAGNNTIKYENLNYQGTEYTNQDVSGFDYIHVDFWTPNSTALNFFLISPGQEIAYPLPITLETWVSVDIPLSAFVPPVILSDVFQFKVDGNGTVYFDNWYFWRNPVNPGADATLSDLLIDGETIDGFSPLTLSYSVELPFGTTEVPTVSAITNNPAATFEIDEATALPGTTEIVVTSEDETNTLTYSIAFTVAPETPLSEFCETETWHFMNPAEVPSVIYLTITNLDATSMFIEIESANDDPVDYLLVNGGSGATISPENTSVPGKISRTLTWTETPPEDVVLNVLWSKESSIGNWQLSQGDITVPFDAACGPTVPSVSFSPNDGAIDVSVSVQPAITFSVPVEMADGSTITNGDIANLVIFKETDASGANVPFVGSINTESTVISIDPVSDLAIGQAYYFALNNEVISFTEGNLIPGQSITFTTVLGVDATLSDLKVDGTTVDGFSPSILNYDFELPLGTVIVPVVTATTNDPEASMVITNPLALPDTAQVVVTSQDGTTTLTYKVNYILGGIEPTTTPPVPTHAEADVLSIYSDAYSNLPNVNYNPAWGQQTIVTVNYNIAGNNTIMYENLNYQGTEFTVQDVSGYEFIHLDFWTANATELGFSLISQGPLEKEYVLTIEPETWVSVDIPLSYFVPPVSLGDVFQFKVTGDGDVWFDNWYFWRNPVNPEGDATLSDLLVDGTTVEGFLPSVLDYDVELPFGSTEVPTVTAVTNYANASYIINIAAALPGTTEVVVTSEDETNTLTYSIDFTVAPETPLSEYCETEVWHFMNPAELASAIYLTITNVDASSMLVEIESANDDPVDYLLVLGGSGATISEADTLIPGKISRTLTWTETPPEDVMLNVLWSKESSIGNWQLSQGDMSVPFDAICGPAIPSVSFSPNDGAIDILVNVQPTLTFSVSVEMANGSEITNADIPSFVSFNEDDALGQAVPYSASINTGKTLVTIVPDNDLENGQTYYFAIADQMIKYMDGELLGGQSVTFTTEAGPKPYLELDVQDNFEGDGYATIDNWKFQDSPDLVDLTITEDPLNATNNVADYNRSGTFLYTNAQVILDHRMDLTERHVFTLKAYFPSTNDYSGDLAKTAAIKLQNSLLGALAYTTQTEVVKTVNVLNAWVTLTFDFGAAADSVNYDQIVVQLGGENHLVPAQLYFDNLLLKEILIGPQADFTATPVNGYAPLTVQFTDMSTFVASSWQWDFDNDGTVDSNVKNPSYTYVNPGYYSVKLIATNPFVGTSELIKVDYIFVSEAPQQQLIQIPPGWSSISSYVLPENASIESLFGSIADKIEIMVGDGGVYYPSQGINTIIDWNSQSGYVIKTTESAEVTFNGQEAASGTITVSAGWSLIPVTISCDVNVADLFGAFPQVIAIKEVAGIGMYWPEKGINTMISLSPGKAYYILTNDDLTFSYPACLEGYELIWSDEFDESEINTDN